MKIILLMLLAVVVLVLGAQIYSFLGREGELKADFAEIKAKLDRATTDQEKFQAELDYYLNPVNLEKELRARFNYKRPGEKLIIIVPRSTSSNQQPATSN